MGRMRAKGSRKATRRGMNSKIRPLMLILIPRMTPERPDMGKGMKPHPPATDSPQAILAGKGRLPAMGMPRG
jgi:hypothetical protein